MIQEFVDAIVGHKEEMKAELSEEVKACNEGTSDISYETLFKLVKKYIGKGEHIFGSKNFMSYGADICSISFGSYQGDIVYIMWTGTKFYYGMISYGSCTYCDTLQHILFYADSEEQQVSDLYTLCLHIAQALKPLETSYAE